jgi:hypothetical protein
VKSRVIPRVFETFGKSSRAIARPSIAKDATAQNEDAKIIFFRAGTLSHTICHSQYCFPWTWSTLTRMRPHLARVNPIVDTNPDAAHHGVDPPLVDPTKLNVRSISTCARLALIKGVRETHAIQLIAHRARSIQTFTRPAPTREFTVTHVPPLITGGINQFADSHSLSTITLDHRRSIQTFTRPVPTRGLAETHALSLITGGINQIMDSHRFSMITRDHRRTIRAFAPLALPFVTRDRRRWIQTVVSDDATVNRGCIWH